MPKAREIRTKIASIKNTQKITRAMELVAASKMRKAQDRMAMSRPYASKIRKVISHIAASHSEYPHPYLQQRENIKRVGYIIVTTDRGLCGGLNVNLFRTAIADMTKWQADNIGVDLCVIGRKGEAFFRRYKGNVLTVANHLGDAPEVQDIIGIVKVMLDQYDKQKIDAIYIANNEFVNTMLQKPLARQLLPLKTDEEEVKGGYWDYIYEPDESKYLLEILLVRYIESQVYQAVIENIACEQSARMVAMKNATENAGQLIDELWLIYNKARQAGITQEIAEIVAGAAAVE
ncbi:F0F1 ATP synthase subunit gamma [Coxiella endosymbiont of Ornithodoros amblus]|uniref:F0F1 ATP synthase subunit gamma n=1 Tax=Coxiella endosymbiont of Ornithodoros amblus TaxID=1656166 RepID=UPI00244DFD9D|nr:F0F1 ATP synthase subunit gamma [Coxiella endosymbiont of Ornithodoros amblus]MBW5802408.1 F0F1 ATP synthase subunit gamma [Coxiella endosymbiont of Ornithodoros amblus]